MARRNEHRLLTQVAAVRDIQRQAAQAQLMHASLALRESETARADGVTHLASQHAQWVSALSEPSMNLGGMTAWGQAVGDAVRDLDVLDHAVRDAQTLKTARAEALGQAQARAEAVEVLKKSARRRETRAREEVVLADLADRATLAARR
jgi:hypothetical protein